MAASIRLGRRHLGQTAPNPAVGCIIVRDGIVVGSGITGWGGRPHGETEALKDAGDKARGATVYVSLEPCNHYGKTGPCTVALIDAGVARVVIGLGDSDERVNGAGAQRLRDAGIAVDFEPSPRLAKETADAHRGHLMRMRDGRPFVTLKLALSADGGIGIPDKGQVPITGMLANRLSHGLRARHDAIAVGSRTVLADKPQLTVRLPGLGGWSPSRFVFTRNGNAFPDLPEGWQALESGNLAAALKDLGGMGMTSLLVEGGATIAKALLEAHLVDELYLLRGQAVLGEGAVTPFPAHPFDSLEGAGLKGWCTLEKRTLGLDTLWRLQPPHI
ncbi:MAG: bifunctional diaminohydroxyphosphoribosylaminopyrimidine deaminase/5-amino-6-(5-phosphoribosylamino)uracil reductase RibD [Pseudomonadota bacterium]